MKFGRMLRTTAEDLPEMQSLFVSYKQLKKQLKRLPYKEQLQGEGASTSASLTEEENNFVAALSSTLQQMNDIFLEKEETGVIKIDQLESELASATQPQQLDALHKELVDFHGEVLLLVHWSILAYTATVKILKKHHKRTGLLLRAPQLGDLLSQPFCSTELMTGIAHRVEDDIAALSRRLGKPPPAPDAPPLLAGLVPEEVARVSSSALSNKGLDMELLQRLADSESATTHSSDERRDGRPSVEGAAVEDDTDMADGTATSSFMPDGSAPAAQQQLQGQGEGDERPQERQQRRRRADEQSNEQTRQQQQQEEGNGRQHQQQQQQHQQQQQQQQEDRREPATATAKRQCVGDCSNAAGQELLGAAEEAAAQQPVVAALQAAAAQLPSAGAASHACLDSVPLAAAVAARGGAAVAALHGEAAPAIPAAAEGLQQRSTSTAAAAAAAAAEQPGADVAPVEEDVAGNADISAGNSGDSSGDSDDACTAGLELPQGSGLGQQAGSMRQQGGVVGQQSIMRQTQVALTTWAHLKSSASTPSTMIAAPAPPHLPAGSSAHTGSSTA